MLNVGALFRTVLYDAGSVSGMKARQEVCTIKTTQSPPTTRTIVCFTGRISNADASSKFCSIIVIFCEAVNLLSVMTYSTGFMLGAPRNHCLQDVGIFLMFGAVNEYDDAGCQ